MPLGDDGLQDELDARPCPALPRRRVGCILAALTLAPADLRPFAPLGALALVALGALVLTKANESGAEAARRPDVFEPVHREPPIHDRPIPGTEAR